MDWRAINFDWNLARAFLVTVEEGSLSAAARALGKSQPTIGRQITALEKELGVVLFERVGLGLELTPSGIELFDHVCAMGEAATSFSLTAKGKSQALEGNICISASDVYAVFYLPAIVAKIRQQHPKIKIEIVATDKSSDLRRREADIALRNFRPTQPDLISRKIKDVNARLYASPGYLRTIGNPQNNDELSNADFINFDNSGMLLGWLNNLGLNLSKSNFPILSENHIVHWELVKQGLGIGIMPEAIGDAEPAVVRVMEHFPAIEFPIWLTTHRELNHNRRVRAVYDILASELSS